MIPALSSIVDSPLKIAFAVLLVAVIVLALLLRRGSRKPSANTTSWKSYIGGPGTILFVFLLIGGLLAGLSWYLGPPRANVIQGGQFVEYRDLDPSKQVVFEEQDVEHYRQITVLAQSKEPQDGSAIVTIYGDAPAGGKHEAGRVETNAGSWSRWDQKNLGKHVTLTIASGAGAHPATKVDVLIFLSSEKSQ